MERHWTLADIPWAKFDSARVAADLVPLVKAAAMVEHNSGDYVTYLCNVFPDDAEFRAAAAAWGVEEVQHGQALARWAEMADPAWNFSAAFARFVDNYRLPLDAETSVRGSRAGELIARCIVEVGTSSFYSAIRDACGEPVLKHVCNRIAGDEFRHYKLFYDHLRRYRRSEDINLAKRLFIAFGRVAETGDDELATAYWAGNDLREAYDRERHGRAYAGRAGRLYRFGHIQRAVGMALKACGLEPQGRIGRLASRAAWNFLQRRNANLARLVA
jgi:hypothetical protein